MKTFKDGTHYRSSYMKQLCEALIMALTHERAAVPPVDIPYDLDTAAMLCTFSRRQLLDYLRRNRSRYKIKVNKITKQSFLLGDDIKQIRSEVIDEQAPNYSANARKLPCVQRILAANGPAEGGGD